MSMHRREFAKRGIAAGLIATGCVDGVSAGSASEMPIIDTHQHLWDLVEFKPPWLEGSDASIAVKHDMRDYLTAIEGLNVVKAIYMEVDVAPDDQLREAQYVLNLIGSKVVPTVAAVISGRPGLTSFASAMEPYRHNSLIKGVRQVLHSGSAPHGLCLQPPFVRSIQLLGEMGKSFDLCMRPTELADGRSLAQQCPDTLFILDHCGNADVNAWQPKSKQRVAPKHEVDTWKKDIEQLAFLPNVVCKISGIVAGAPKGWKAEDLGPPIDHCLDHFGFDRVVFGGDWPVCKLGATYAQWVDALKQIVGNRSHLDQMKLFHDNAVVHYKLAE